MKITVDLSTNKIIVPDKFFTEIAKENDLIKSHGGTPVEAKDRITNAVNAALKDTEANLLTKSAYAKLNK